MQEILVICIVAAAGIYLIHRYKPVLTQALKKNQDNPEHGDGQGCCSCCGGCSCHADSRPTKHHSPGADA